MYRTYVRIPLIHLHISMHLALSVLALSHLNFLTSLLQSLYAIPDCLSRQDFVYVLLPSYLVGISCSIAIGLPSYYFT